VCLFVFCLDCSKASHGNTACGDHAVARGQGPGEARGQEGAGQEGEGEEGVASKDYTVFAAMLRKTGPRR
jgi:hypothetical protein